MSRNSSPMSVTGSSVVVKVQNISVAAATIPLHSVFLCLIFFSWPSMNSSTDRISANLEELQEEAKI